MDQEELSVELNVKSVIYILNLTASLTGNEKYLTIEIQNTQTAEFWKGTYDEKYIEDLTRKTGNFKSFKIFVNMLQSALNQESNTVTIDLLTFSDLENLRNKSCLNSSTSSSVSRHSMQHNNSNKKYLIMTYNVEFDRINYPLQLRYQGKLDSVILLDIIRNLRSELKSSSPSSSSSSTSNNLNDFELKKSLKRLENENHNLKKENESLEIENQRLTNLSQESKLNSSQTIDMKTLKELNSLKKMIKSIEEDAIKEKTLYQKQLIKKTEEINKLKTQMNKMVEHERNMCNKLKAIKDLELSARTSRINSRASSKESVQRIPIPTPVRTGHKSRLMQNNSKERCTKAAPSSQHRFQSNSLDRFSRASSSSNRKVSLSPASSTRSKRFDPTEYIRQKKTKELNTQQRNRSRNNSSSNNYNNLSSDDCSKASANNQRPRSKQSKKRSNLLENNQHDQDYLNSSLVLNYQENISQQNRPKLTSNINSYNRDEEMREIDAKLKSLHNLIKYSL